LVAGNWAVFANLLAGNGKNYLVTLDVTRSICKEHKTRKKHKDAFCVPKTKYNSSKGLDKHFRIIWVCPPWSDQIRRGLHEFHIGIQATSGKARVTCTESYFVSEGIVCKREELLDEKQVSLFVIGINDDGLSKKVNDFIGQESSLLVDMDLDYFSTKNPFIELYLEANLYSKLKKLYTFDAAPEGLPDDAKVTYALESCDKRAKLLDELEDIFQTFRGAREPGKLFWTKC
jgi:hypothetical protein